MNILSLCTRRTDDPRVFDVYWRTGLLIKGRVIVTMPSHVSEDANIAAELSAARYLLEDRNVCGDNKAGRGLTIRVTFGAIKKLAREESEKGYLAPYAHFLRTRFAGLLIEVENTKVDWADEGCARDVAELVVDGPVMNTILVGGFGEVELSSHAVQRYIEKFEVKPVNAWRKLRDWAPQAVKLPPLPKSWRQTIKYPREASFAVSHNQEILLVVTPAKPGRKHPCLVTLYPVDERMRADLARLRHGST